jgi:hypothetical protein
MKAIETSINIKASPAKIWEVFSNFNLYPAWNPFIISVKHQPVNADRLEIIIQIGTKKPQIFKPKILKNEENKEFKWKGKLLIPGLFDGEHYFTLEKISETETKFTQGEKFSGILLRPIMKMIQKDTIEGFQKMNQALKERVELNRAS